MLGSKEAEQGARLVQFARVLPNNATSAKILKEEEERARAKEEREKAVSLSKQCIRDSIRNSNDVSMLSYSLKPQP